MFYSRKMEQYCACRQQLECSRELSLLPLLLPPYYPSSLNSYSFFYFFHFILLLHLLPPTHPIAFFSWRREVKLSTFRTRGCGCWIRGKERGEGERDGVFNFEIYGWLSETLCSNAKLKWYPLSNILQAFRSYPRRGEMLSCAPSV